MIFEKNNVDVRIESYSLKTVDYPVRVVASKYDNQKDIAIFFVHGAPGASDNYYRYLQDSVLSSKANLYSIDRPGYGFSNFGKPETSIKKQTEVVAEIINGLPEKQVIVLGHSYGGPIASYASILSPKVKGVLMLAPAIDPENEKIFWFAYISKWKLTKWMVLGAMCVAGEEKFTHVEELNKLKDIWKHVKVPTVHMHGIKDVIVPFDNIQFSTKAFNPQYLDTVVLKDANHFLPWKQYPLVKKKLLDLINTIE